MLYTDNLIKSHFGFRRRRKKNHRLLRQSRNISLCKMNRRLAAGALSVLFKKPWNYLAEMPAEARCEAPSEATNRLWWCLLEKVRTHFERNPD